MSEGSDGGGDSGSSDSSTGSSWSSGQSYSNSDTSYTAAMNAYNQANTNYSNSQGPEAGWAGGEAAAPETWADRAWNAAGGWGGVIGGGLGLLSGLPGGMTLGNKLGSAIGNGDQANHITNFNADGTVTGWNPDSTSMLNGGSGYHSTGNLDNFGVNQVATSNIAGGLAAGAASPAAAITPTALTAAQQQAKDNLEAARVSTTLNRPDQNTPYGNQTWTNTPGTDQWVSNITLAPVQQQLLDAQNAGAVTKSTLANKLLNTLNTTGVPQYQSSVELNQTLGQKDDLKLNTNLTPSQIQASAAQAAQAAAERAAGMNLSALGAMPTASDADKQRVEQALYAQEMSRLDPMWAQRQSDMQSQLANQGITLGSGAYDTSVGQFGRDRNDAYQTALNAAITGGGAEQTRLFNLGMDVRKQGFSEQSKVADVNVANTQSANQVAMANAANATQVAIANANRELEASKAEAQNKLDTNAAINKALMDQTTSNNNAINNNANFANTAKLNQMNANNGTVGQILSALGQLQSGTAPTLPTFASGNSGATVAPVQSAAIAQNQSTIDQAKAQADLVAKTAKDNAEQQSRNSIISALGGLGSSIAGSNWVSSLF